MRNSKLYFPLLSSISHSPFPNSLPKLILLSNPLLFKILRNPPRAMALFPFILLESERDKYDKVLINHEKIHLYQQLEMLIIPFYLVYLVHYLIQLTKYKKHHKAYMNIVFERESYQNEWNLEYLKNRKLWAFGKYWTKERGNKL